MYKLGFDIDEVLVKTMDKAQKYLYNEFGVELDFNTITEFRLNEHPLYEEYSEAFESLFEKFQDMDFFDDCSPYGEAVKVLKKLNKKGHELYFISNRPKNGEEKTALWFRKHKIPFTKIYHTNFHREKGSVGRQLNLDFYVDDRPKDIESMLKYKHRWTKGLFIFDKPWNKDYYDSKVGRIYDWYDILNVINIPAKKNN